MGELILKAGGILCVMGAAVAFGESKARALSLRLRHLRQFQRSLQLLISEISFTRTLLPHAFRAVAAECSSPVREIYRGAAELLENGGALSAGEAWRQALEKVLPSTCLHRADGEILLSLGVSLGVREQEGQLKQIQLTLQHLEYALEEAHENRERHEKMWRYLGVLGGAFLVILLL